MDTPLILTLCAIQSGAAALIMLIAHRSRKTYNGFGFWLLGIAALTIGSAMLIPGYLSNDWYVRLVRNALLIGGFILIQHGLLVFRDIRFDPAWEWIFFLSFLAIFSYFNVVQPDLNARISTFAIYASAICFASLYVLLYRRPAFFATSDLLLAAWLGIFGLLNASRFLTNFLNPDISTAFETLSKVGAYYAAAQSISVQLLVLSLISMNAQRIEWDLHSELAKTREAQEIIRTLEESANDAIVTIDSAGHISYWNRAAESIFGSTRSSVLGKPFRHFIASSESTETDAWIDAILSYKPETPQEQAVEIRCRKSDGSLFHVEMSASKLLDADNRHTTFILRDISERKRHEKELLSIQGEMQATLRAIPDVLFELDSTGRYLQVHAPSEELLVQARSSLLGKRVAEVMPQAEAEVVLQAIQSAISSGHSGGQKICLRLDDGERWFELSTARMKRERESFQTVIMLSRDITQRMQDIQKIEILADFDHLTGLPNRKHLQELFDTAAARATRHDQKLTVAFLDIDHFKNINDTLGHALGDQLLKEVAERLRHALRDTDIACRIGGDEFVLIFDDCGIEVATRLTQRLQKVMHKPFHIGPYKSGVTLSVGVSIFPDDGRDLDALLRNADSAMYKAKADGRNTVRFYTAAMQLEAERLLELSSALSQAIERGEMSVWYQPVQQSASARISGCEALLRWSNPSLGAVSPAEFIPVAESAGLILAIGEWVLNEACQQAVAWNFNQRKWVMAVNVSMIQFKQKDFISNLEEILERSGLNPDLLELELTESVAMGDVNAAVDVVQRLHELGVKIAIDDFGTGYSSMSYLRRFGFNSLKIDQGFVRKIGTDSADESIIIATIQLAHSLGMYTIAEGVETAPQHEFLQSHACDYEQGWLYAKALPTAEWGPYLAVPQALA